LLYGGRTVCRTRVGVLLAYKESRDFPVLLYVPTFYLQTEVFRGGRCWDRTSDLCRVKAALLLFCQS
jgi:hypothetical protein